MYLVALIVLPAIAFLVGPLFCGWLCPAGIVTELLGRLVPDRFKLSLGGRINPTPIRYGVLVGMFAAPFLGSYICCTYCNFNMMQHLVLAATGDITGLTAWASFTILTFVVWFFLLGLFVKGGRGWCNLLCPAAAVQGLVHAWGARFGFTWAIRRSAETCSSCGQCVTECPAWALSAEVEVNLHACNGCRDCLHVCRQGALRYVRRQGNESRSQPSPTGIGDSEPRDSSPHRG